MSRPAPGSYIIYNRALSPSGEKLAITFVGQGNTLTVTPKTNSTTQIVRCVSSVFSNYLTTRYPISNSLVED